jgi:type I restriction enzyme S subunit
MKAWQGSYGVSNYKGIVSPAYYIFNILGNINKEFFHLAIRTRAYVLFFSSASDGVRIGQWDLSIERMKEIPLFIPPLLEQIDIVKYCNEVLVETEAAIKSQQKQITNLKEYKQTLIANVVTGKIKVA